MELTKERPWQASLAPSASSPPEGAAVWAFDAQEWWEATVVDADSSVCVVHLKHGVSAPVPIDRVKPRDPTRNGADRPRKRR
ncbi:MAG: hypothetical protein ACREQI_07270 [Candidatus Binataceae bacterium]